MRETILVAIRQFPFYLLMSIIGAAVALLLATTLARADTPPKARWSFAGQGHAGTTACVSRSTALAASRFDEMIDWTARAFVVRPSFLRAVVACESNFNDHAESSAGARGLAQVMPQTA